MSQKDSHVRQLAQLIIRYGLDRKYREFRYYVYLIDRGRMKDSRARRILRSRQFAEILQQLREQPRVLPRSPGEQELWPGGSPDIEIGTLIESPDVRFGLRFDRPAHGIVAGATGFGKSSFLQTLCVQTHRHNLRHPDRRVCIVYFDRKGLDACFLPAFLGDDWLHLSVYDGLRVALNAPAGIATNIWLQIIITQIASRTGMKFSTPGLVRLTRWLLGLLNEQPHGQVLFPSLHLILEAAQVVPFREFTEKDPYRATMNTVLTNLTNSSGNLLRCASGFDLERHIIGAAKNVVIHMPALEPPELRRILVDIVISQALFGRMFRQYQSSNRVEVIFIVDEADQDVLASAEAECPDGLTPISQLIKMGRAFGLSLILSLSSLQGVSRFVLANTLFQAFFQFPDAINSAIAADTLCLPRSGKSFQNLNPGECIVRTAQSTGWHEPFLCKIDPPPERVAPRAAYDSHPFVPSKALKELPNVMAAITALRLRSRGAKQREFDLRQAAQDLLRNIADHPFLPIVRLWESLGKPSPAVQRKVHDELGDLKVVAFQDRRMERANRLLAQILPRGWEVLDRPPVHFGGAGSIAHIHSCNWIRLSYARRGHKAKIEAQVPGTTHRADVLVRIGETIECFEVIDTCFDNITSHIRACLIKSDVVDRVTIVTFTKGDQKKIQKLVQDDADIAGVTDRVHYALASQFLEEAFE